MPWHIEERNGQQCVIKTDDGSEAGCHDTKEEAEAQIAALYASEGDMAELQDEPPPADLPVPRWRMLAVDESRPTDDGRAFRSEGILTWREPPFALTWTDEITDGHLGAKLGGTVDRVERQGPQIWFYGTFTDDESGMELLTHIRACHPLFPSVTIADELAVWEQDDLGRELFVFESGKLIGNTLTPEQAQEGTFIELDEEPIAIAACAGPQRPPLDRFRKPALAAPTSLTVTDDGHVFGNVAGPGCHIGILDRCVKVGATSRDFTLFHKGQQGDGGGIMTAEGERVRVGQITLVGGHADLHFSADAARRHYDDTRSAVADVVVGWDEGDDLPWFSGSLRPGVTEDQVQALRAAGVSGDWRVIEGEHRLVALPAVNVPGFPVRVRALVAAGEVQAMVAKLAPETPPTYAMVALIPSEEEAAILALDGGEPPEKLHVTLVYLGPEATGTLDRQAVEEAVAGVAAGFEPVTGLFNGSCYFGEGDEGYPLVTTLDAPGLTALRETLAAVLRSAVEYPDDTHGFVPHLTRAYVPEPPSAIPAPPMLDVIFADLCVCWGDYQADPANLTRIPLGTVDEAMPEDVGGVTASALVVLALERLDEQVWRSTLDEMDRRVGA